MLHTPPRRPVVDYVWLLALLTCAASPARSASTDGATFAVVVGFGSECCGVDNAARDALNRVVARFPRSTTGRVEHDWGKEGETDVCFTLEALSTADRARFVADLRGTVAAKLVTVSENGACHAER